MQTKLIVGLVIGVVVAAAVYAWWYYANVEPPTEIVEPDPDPAPEPLATDELPSESWDPGRAETPRLEGSPHGLYDDLSDAFNRAGERPDVDYAPVERQPLSPPVREDEPEAEEPPG